jgi:geranylgeranyl pyrophosphate synthase
MLREASTGVHDPALEAALRAALKATGSIDHARDEASRLVEEAKSLLDGVAFGPAASLLRSMADSVVARAK